MNDVPLREFIERIIQDNNLRRDDLRMQDNRRFDESVASVDKALKLQAAETERRLEAYPTVKDFNTLKSRVDIELESRASSSKGVILMFQIMSATAVIISVVVAILNYASLR